MHRSTGYLKDALKHGPEAWAGGGIRAPPCAHVGGPAILPEMLITSTDHNHTKSHLVCAVIL